VSLSKKEGLKEERKVVIEYFEVEYEAKYTKGNEAKPQARAQ
jgi:hypothetical protein